MSLKMEWVVKGVYHGLTVLDHDDSDVAMIDARIKEKVCHFDLIEVAEIHREKGLGASLFSLLLERARSLGCTVLVSQAAHPATVCMLAKAAITTLRHGKTQEPLSRRETVEKVTGGTSVYLEIDI